MDINELKRQVEVLQEALRLSFNNRDRLLYGMELQAIQKLIRAIERGEGIAEKNKQKRAK